MKECRFCKRPLKEEDAMCSFCGYNPKIDAIDPLFNSGISPTKKKGGRIKEKKLISAAFGVDPRIKKFAFVGIAITLFSIFYKYNFNINLVGYEVSHFFKKIKADKFIIWQPKKEEAKGIEKAELINVRSFEVPQMISQHKNKNLMLEGIFFDDRGGSFVTINGKVIAEGESIDNLTVKKINNDSVEVIIDGEVKVLKMQ